MPDYKQGKIYTIRCKTDDTLIYIGCTTQSLCERMAKYRYDSMKRSNNFFYQHINTYVCLYVCIYIYFELSNLLTVHALTFFYSPSQVMLAMDPPLLVSTSH
jgi:hypothetical protein